MATHLRLLPPVSAGIACPPVAEHTFLCSVHMTVMPVCGDRHTGV